MSTKLKLLAAVSAISAALALSSQAQAAQCMRAGGWGTGALQSFASFMSEAAMKNSAKARLGDAVKIGPTKTKCEIKGLLYECTSSARACK
ncbi:MAG: hypothetical protein NW223_08465 [Hyphomicrobiaceae bacterium]|nr:hypothetical protein [Hyphomicrobiaceae bacterium]